MSCSHRLLIMAGQRQCGSALRLQGWGPWRLGSAGDSFHARQSLAGGRRAVESEGMREGAGNRAVSVAKHPSDATPGEEGRTLDPARGCACLSLGDMQKGTKPAPVQSSTLFGDFARSLEGAEGAPVHLR
ncbi:uncharacterized protein LOC118143727 isoform X2 [Callithrix jacchus]